MTTKDNQKLIANQVDLQNEIVAMAKINIVNCGNCGSIFLHRTDDNDNVICPFCYENMAKSDCPDYFYTGLEFSGEFEFNNEAN